MPKIDDCLSTLCNEFTESCANTWLRNKFPSYDTSLQSELSVNGNKNEAAYFESARLLGCIRSLPESKGSQVNRPIVVVAVKMKEILTDRASRSVQFNFAKRIIQEKVRSGANGLNGFPSQGLFFFYDNEQFFRMSLVSGEMEGRRFKFNEVKRQSFYIDPERPNNVAKSRLSERIETYEDLKCAFSVDSLTKEFYKKLFDWYEWAMAPQTGVTFPNDTADSTDDRKYNNEAIIRLITRLMFTWFIRQRKMVPDEFFSVDGVKSLLKDFDRASMEQTNYYHCILQNLFFATFNCQPNKRKFIEHKPNGFSDGYMIKTLYRYENDFLDSKKFISLVAKIPFLNCALFDCLDRKEREQDGGRELLFDGFSDTKKRQAHVPNGLFFDEERGIIKLFNAYEFTIDENNPDDADVALDPELLGKVFENLLGAFNPETKETARKATGSFYTPREIVNYMVDESLKSYIKTKLMGAKGEKGRAEEVVEAWLNDLFDKTATSENRQLPFDNEVANEICEALYVCKILDPACGSGAFPMGILQAMVRLFGRLDPGNTSLNDRLFSRYKNETAQEYDSLYTQEEWDERKAQLERQLKEGQLYPDYARKLYLIENCIYGVDIQPIATQISKLRFFISLLCDQLRSNWNEDAANQGLLSLPNLEAKFVCANTLISLPKTDGEFELATGDISKLRDKLQENRHNIFTARSSRQKDRCKANDLVIRDKIRNTISTTLKNHNEEEVTTLKSRLNELAQERTQYTTPNIIRRRKAVQGTLFNEMVQNETEYEEVDINKEKCSRIDMEISNIRRKIKEGEGKRTTGAGIVDQIASLIAGWDPYDQNASSSFFDAKWMFNIENGFDIVIGNPPYGARMSDKDKKYCSENYVSAKTVNGCRGSIDTYSLFVERGYDICTYKGCLAYILPLGIVSTDSMASLHTILFDNCHKIRCSSYAVRPQPIFENATVDTTILMFHKTLSPCKVLYSTKMYRKGANLDLSNLISNLAFVDVHDICLRGRIPKIGTDIERSILRKILSMNNISIGELKKQSGSKIYYRAAGGRYFKVVTCESTGSHAEKYKCFDESIALSIGCILSSSLSFWFYQIFSDNHNWKSYEIESFKIPTLDKIDKDALVDLYKKYLADINAHANVRQSSESSSYHVESFKEYKIGYSKKIIDEIDDFIGPLYGLTKEEIEFIKNYEIEFRMADYLQPEQIAELVQQNKAIDAPRRRRRTIRPSSNETHSSDDEYLE